MHSASRLLLSILAALALTAALPASQASACPGGYFPCGSACCPGK